MTVRAITGELAVVTHDVEPGLFNVIEALRVNGPEIRISPLVFGMAYRAVANRDFPMDALLRGHSPGDLIVTDQTTVSVDIEIVVVAAVAAVGIFQAFVSEAQVTGHEIDLVFLCEHGQDARGHSTHQKECPEARSEPSDWARVDTRTTLMAWRPDLRRGARFGISRYRGADKEPMLIDDRIRGL